MVSRFPPACFFFFLLLGGCASSPSWKEVKLPAALPEDDAWLLAEAAAQACDFTLDERLSDPGEGEMVSLWKERLAPFGKGFRLKLHVRLRPGESGKVEALDFYVERQVNQSMESPFSPRPEDWGGGGRDPGTEALFETHLATRLRRFLRSGWKDGKNTPKEGLFPGR